MSKNIYIPSKEQIEEIKWHGYDPGLYEIPHDAKIASFTELGIAARTGMKDSYEVRRKRSESLSKALSGVPRPYRRKTVIIDNTEYVGVQSVTEKYNISRQTVYNRIKSDDWNWHYAKPESILFG